LPLDACRECGHELSTDAPSCPHCGIRWPSELGRADRIYTRRRDLGGCLVGLGAVVAAGMLLGALRLQGDLWLGLALLGVMAAYGLYWTWADNARDSAISEIRRKKRCDRCGVTGTTEPFQGALDSYPEFYQTPIQLCALCRFAQESWLRHRFMLQTEGRFHFGRAETVREAEQVWGDRALDMLALLLLASDDMDGARRLLTRESFEEARPWLEANMPDAES